MCDSSHTVSAQLSLPPLLQKSIDIMSFMHGDITFNATSCLHMHNINISFPAKLLLAKVSESEITPINGAQLQHFICVHAPNSASGMCSCRAVLPDYRTH